MKKEKEKKNQEGNAVKSGGEEKLFCREGQEEGDGERKGGKYLWKGKMLPRERMDKQEGFVKNPCRPKTVLSKKYDNVWSF